MGVMDSHDFIVAFHKATLFVIKQVHLLAWRETVPASATEAEKPELVSQRIRFPLGTTCGVATAATYIFRSAALVDVQVTVDSASACVVITSVWRAEAVPANEPMCEKGFLFEALVGRNTVPLCELRAQHNILGSVSELMSPGEMVLAVNSAEHERLRLRDQDTQLCRHLQESWAAPQADLRAAEKTLKVFIFLVSDEVSTVFIISIVIVGDHVTAYFSASPICCD